MNKPASAFALIVLFSLISVPIAFAPQDGNYIRADGSVEGTSSIKRVGNVYTFTGNVSHALYVETDNIVIDGAGYTLSGNDGRALVIPHSNVVVKNLRLELHEGFVIDLTGASNCTFEGNTLAGNPSADEGSTFPSTGFTWWGPDGIYISKSGNITIKDNTFVNCGTGISLYYSNNNIITGNTITNCATAGIEFWNSSSNILKNNHLTNSTISIRAYSTDYRYENDVDLSNTIDEKPVVYWVGMSNKTTPSNAGYVALVNCTNITVQDANAKGMLIVSTTRSTISRATLAKGGVGIAIVHSLNNSIVDNQIRDFAIGLDLTVSSNNIIARNTFTNCVTRGIAMEGSNNNLIIENKFVNNSYAAGQARDSSSSGNTFSRNTFSGSQFALTPTGSNIISDNVFTDNYNALMCSNSPNTITGNTFRNNGQALYISGKENVLRNNVMDNNNNHGFVASGLISSDYGHTNTVNIVPNDVDTSNKVDGKPIIYWINQHDKTVPANAACVILVSCSNIVVQDLNTNANGQGIVLIDTSGSTVKNNNVTNNGYGIGLFGGEQNTLTGNYVALNGQGMYIGDSTENTIINNSFIANSHFAIVLTGTQKSNTLHHNNFIDINPPEKLPISIDKFSGPGWGNRWDDGKEGNYWSDYVSRYGEQPTSGLTFAVAYEINENNIDHHPLINPVGNPVIPSTPTRTPEPTPTPQETSQPTTNSPSPSQPSTTLSPTSSGTPNPASGFLGTTIPNEIGYGLIITTAIIVTSLTAYLILRRHKPTLHT